MTTNTRIRRFFPILLLLPFLLQPSCTRQAEGYTIPTLVKLIGVQWFNRMEVGVQRFKQETGHEAYLIGPSKADAALQVQMLEDLIAQGVDAVAVVPFSPEALEPALRKAMDQGIVVITHESSGQRNFDYDIEPFDNQAYGAHLMDALARCMGERGEFAVFVGSLTSRTHNEWIDAAVARQVAAYPRMTLVGGKNESYDNQQNAYSKTQELFRAFPQVRGFLGSASTDVAGIGLAVEDRGYEQETCVIGTSLPSVSGQYLSTAAVDQISFWDPADAGYVMNQAALRVLQQQPIRTGDDFGVAGYENVTVRDRVVYGQAWVDVTAKNMSEYPF